MKSLPNCLRSLVLLQCHLQPSMHLQPHELCLILGRLRKKRRGPVLLMAVHAMQAPPDLDSCSITTLCLEIPEGHFWWEVFTACGSSGHAHGNAFYLDGEMVTCVIVF